MTEKIEWYKEVLELEPNSKVFFPLARMLAEEQRYDEAVEVLERGLERHSEFLEARLFFIELLFKTGRRPACTAQVNKLSTMFAAYAGFWQAWAACLSASGESPDAAAVLRVLAANFLRGPVSLHELLDRGVASLLEENAGQESGRPVPQPVNAAGEAQIAPVQPQPAEDAPQSGSTEAESVKSEGFFAFPESEENEMLLPLEGAPGASAALPDTDVAVFADAPEPEYGGETAFDPAAAMADDEPLPEETSAAVRQEAEANPAAQNFAVKKQAEAGPGTESAVFPRDESEDAEERFSLRTRSMAEVLAEQGDIRGALDIYYELAAAAVSLQETADLQQRIATLSARLGTAQEADEAPPPAQPESASGKDKLISMLEALAERVEARAHS
ncbi:hypothetical protein [Desulfovibrio sp. ZJ200]|uniref:hypothetical protein n=1 Tax=Desulfovibrio sp. ZJ200 TaxID=2709792 RepID=UPI0013EA7AFA|nr:hypothetical protein [Desulfovibrio sp. ZJ200]